MKDFIKIKVSLNDTKPQIWRRIQLHKNITFFELHHIIQIAMGWKNYHMFEFKIEGFRIGEIYDDEMLDGYYDKNSQYDCRTTKISDVITDIGETFQYVYDFGDYWKHTLEVEDDFNYSGDAIYPLCVAGDMACPVEDSGGIHGHYQNLEILKDKKHPEYRDTKTWMPRGYDPQKFNLENVNKQLDKIDKYIFNWIKKHM